MVLTAAEFCQFNLNSRLQLLSKDGTLIVSNIVESKYIHRIYYIYRFLVEVLIQVVDHKVIKAEPVFNNDILTIYN